MKSKDILDTEEQLEILSREAEGYKQAIGKEVKTAVKDIRTMGSLLLLAGGAFALTFFLTKAFSSGKKEKSARKEEVQVTGVVVREPKKESEIITMIKEQIALFIISIIKDRITTYIKSLEEEKKK